MSGTKRTVSIVNRAIGDGEPCYFLAEVGGNYDSVEDVHRIVDACIRVEIEAVKFQTFEADTITTKDNVFDLDTTGNIPQYELFKKYEPRKELQRELLRYADKKGITAFSSPGHLHDLEFLEQLDVPAYKIGSDVACHIPLLREVARTEKPIVLSTGMATLEEIRVSVEEVLKLNHRLLLLHCVSDYPTHAEHVNLRTMLTLKKEFGLPVGFSDHTIGPEIALAAVALGANAIERHFWVRGNQQGPDAELCSDEQEYSWLLRATRRIENSLGTREKVLSPQETKNKMANRVSIVSLKDIEAGETITPEVVDIRRPGSGIEPRHWEAVIRSRASRAIRAGQPLQWEDIEGARGKTAP